MNRGSYGFVYGRRTGIGLYDSLKEATVHQAYKRELKGVREEGEGGGESAMDALDEAARRIASAKEQCVFDASDDGKRFSDAEEEGLFQTHASSM